MFLSNKKVRSRYIDTPLGVVIKEYTDKDIKIIVIKIKNETLSNKERDDLIKGFVRLAISIAGRYANIKPNLSDDLVSEGVKGIIYAIDKAKDKLEDTNLRAWITANIHRFIGEYVLKDDIIPIPRETKSRLKKQGIDLKTLNRKELKEENLTIDSFDFFDLKEMIYSCANDAIDKLIIDLRLQGFTDTEIAGFLKSGQQMVSKRRSSIENRFNEKDCDI